MVESHPLTIFLFVIINYSVHEIHHGFGHLENLHGFIEPLITFEERIRNRLPTTVILHTKVLDEFIVTRKARGSGLQMTDAKAFLIYRPHLTITLMNILRTTEEIDELTALHDFPPRFNIGHNLIPARSKDIRRQPVTAYGQHTITWLQMNIVSTVKRLLTVCRNISTEMSLIGRLVW